MFFKKSLSLYKRIDTIIWTSIFFNMLGLKLLIDFESKEFINIFFMYHTAISILITIAVSVHIKKPSDNSFIKNNVYRPFFHTFTIWPILMFIIFIKTITLWHALYYLCFIVSAIIIFQQIFWINSQKPIKKQLLFGLIIGFFLWGPAIIIESIPIIYTIFAPLSLSYHFSLALDGILHIGTIFYMIGIPLLLYLLRKKTHETI